MVRQSLLVLVLLLLLWFCCCCFGVVGVVLLPGRRRPVDGKTELGQIVELFVLGGSQGALDDFSGRRFDVHAMDRRSV